MDHPLPDEPEHDDYASDFDSDSDHSEHNLLAVEEEHGARAQDPEERNSSPYSPVVARNEERVETPQETPRLSRGSHREQVETQEEEERPAPVAEEDALNSCVQLLQLSENIQAFSLRMQSELVDEEIDEASSPTTTAATIGEEDHASPSTTDTLEEIQHDDDRLRKDVELKQDLEAAKLRTTEMLRKLMEASALEAETLEAETTRSLEAHMAEELQKMHGAEQEAQAQTLQDLSPDPPAEDSFKAEEVHEFTVQDKLAIFYQMQREEQARQAQAEWFGA